MNEHAASTLLTAISVAVFLLLLIACFLTLLVINLRHRITGVADEIQKLSSQMSAENYRLTSRIDTLTRTITGVEVTVDDLRERSSVLLSDAISRLAPVRKEQPQPAPLITSAYAPHQETT